MTNELIENFKVACLLYYKTWIEPWWKWHEKKT